MMQTEIRYFLNFFLIPSLLPLLLIIFWPRNVAEKDLFRTGKSFIAKTILICALAYITEVVAFKPLYQGSLLFNSFLTSFIIYMLLTGGLIYVSKNAFQKNKLAWIFPLVDFIGWIPYFIWQLMFGFELSKSFHDGLDFLVKFGTPPHYFYFLIPTAITTIIFGALYLYMMRKRLPNITPKSD